MRVCRCSSVLPSERLPAELDKVQRGLLVQLPRAIRGPGAAGRSRRAASTTPPSGTRLYRADLIETSLATGSGQWSVQYTGSVPALLPLPGLNLALQRLKWNHGADALLGEFDGKTPALLLERAGPAVGFFDWRREARPRSAV